MQSNTNAKREFIGWDNPPLQSAIAWLIQNYTDDQGLDLGNVTIVTPGRRAGRRLLEQLASSSAGKNLTPPELCTPTDLPAVLYKPAATIAQPFEATLIRADVLRNMPHDTLAALLPIKFRPADDNHVGWYNFARQLAQLHQALSSELCTFESVITALPEILADDAELQRWHTLAAQQAAYEDALAAHHLADWDALACRAAIGTAERVACDRQIILLATPELNKRLHAMLHSALDAGTSITSLVPAPQSHAEGFDELGCYSPSYWGAQQVDLCDQWLSFVDRPRDQATHTLDLLYQMSTHKAGPQPDAGFDDDQPLQLTWSLDQITVGLCDPAEGGLVERTLEMANLPARDAAGKPLPAARPATLLAAIAAYLRHERLDDFAALVRHPDMHRFVDTYLKSPDPSQRDAETDADAPQADLFASAAPAHDTSQPASLTAAQPRYDWLVELDDWRSRHLSTRINRENIPADRHYLPRLQQAVASLLPDNHESTQRLSQWSEPIAAMLKAVYGVRRLHRLVAEDASLISALSAIRSALLDHQRASAFGEVEPRVSLHEAVSLLLTQLADQAVPAEAAAGSIELLGWLELPLDDAPALVINSLNEGRVPASRSSDPFLPDQLRLKLGMPTQFDRYARDLLLLSVIINSRPHVAVIAARHDASGDPRPPSRLLLACDEQLRAARIRDYYEKSGVVPCISHGVSVDHKPARQADNRFLIPYPDDSFPLPDVLSVTAFRAYLACPYRFYLRYVARLRLIDDRPRELTGAHFGNLAHDVLCAFGASSAADSTSSDAIFNYLSDELSRIATQTYGKHPMAAVQLQVEQLRDRLRAFASLQAKHRADGWKIVSTEQNMTAALDVDGNPMAIRGKVDRVDQHEESGSLLVIDYKSSDKGKSPDKAHRGRVNGETVWTDLQLPLYRVLLQADARWQSAGDQIELAYINLPKTLRDVRIMPSGWGHDEIDHAVDTAREIIRDIRARNFWPPTLPPQYTDEFAQLCLDNVIQRPEIIKQSDLTTGAGGHHHG